MTEADIKYLNHKIKKRKNKRSDGENHLVVVLETKIVKINDISKGENLSEVPEDEILDMLPSHFQERSSVLIELTQPINLGTEEEPQIIHLAESLSAAEREEFITFFRKKKINFAWKYLDMPGLDPNLIMHHLSIAPGVNPVK